MAPAPSRLLLTGRLVGLCLFSAAMLTTGLVYTQRGRYTDQVAELSRQLIGDENTASIERLYFIAQDRVDRLKYSVFGGTTNPFGDDLDAGPAFASGLGDTGTPEEIAAPVVQAPALPPPLVLPETRPLRANPQEGEGVWVTAGLPRSTPEEPLMARTFVRPDTARPYAVVGVLLMDKRRIRLHITGGKEDPGGDLGVKGPGVIPETDRRDLLAAWNGGFRGPHGGYGMVADGKQYRALRSGFASVAVAKDGTVSMGEWGRDLSWSSDLVAVRQNAVLLVDNCEVSKRTNEGNNTWGYVQVNSAEFITWRSAIGLTKNGDLLVASGNSLSAATLAKALWAAGACYAMQLDINTPYVLTSLFLPQEDGALKPRKFMDSMTDNPGRFLSAQSRDFMYATLDESRYVP